MSERNGKKYDPELCLRASEKVPGQFYTYVDAYTLNLLKEFVAEAEMTYMAAKAAAREADRVSVGPLQFQILNEEDQEFYTERRKFKRAPDGVFKFRLPKAKADSPDSDTSF